MRCAHTINAHLCQARRRRDGGHRARGPVLRPPDRGRRLVATDGRRPWIPYRVQGPRRRPPPRSGEEGQRLGVGDEDRPRTLVDQVPQVLPVAGGPARPVPRRVRAERDHGQRQPVDGGRGDRRVQQAVRRDPSDGKKTGLQLG